MSKRFDDNYKIGIKIDDGIKADLFNMINNMDIFEIKIFSIKHKIPLSIQDNNGNNLIHHCIKLNGKQNEIERLNLIKSLYNENVNPDAPNKDNITPIHIACSKQYYQIIKYLIEIGVNINYVDNFNNNLYHYLFGSILKSYNEFKQKSIIPVPTNINLENVKLLKEIRKSIFDKLKENNSLEAIINTIEKSIIVNDKAVSSVRKFQNEYNQILSSTENTETFKVDLLYANYLNEFIRSIQTDWKNFPKTDLIKLHTTQIGSLITEEDISIIKPEGNYKIELKNKADKIINDINNNILKDNDMIELDNLDEYYQNKLNIFITNNGITPLFNITTMDTDNIKKEYDVLNKQDLHDNAIDYADNIINYEYNTFTGGSRLVEIRNEFTDNMIKDLFNINDKERVVGELAYTLFGDYPVPPLAPVPPLPLPPLDFNRFGVGSIQDKIVEYIYNIAINDKIEETERDLIDEINNNINYNYLLELIEKREKYNPGHYVYVFCCAVQGIVKIQDTAVDNINLKLDGDYGLRQGIVLLCSAIYHNQGDIMKSIYNVFKPLMINSIIDGKNEDNKSDIYADFIKLLLYDDKITDININDNNLTNIVNLTKKYMSEDEFTDNDKDKIKQYLNLTDTDIKDIIDCELLGLYIVSYYQKMPHKPLIQNLVDFLVLIRLFEINKKREPKLGNFVDRLKSLYLKPITAGGINIQPLMNNTNNIQFTRLEGNNIDEYFKKLFNTENLQRMYEMISQYQIPSRINFYLYEDFDYLNSNDDERQLYLLKQTEANHFGLNFMGLIPKLDNVTDLTISVDILNTINIQMQMQLYNFNNTENNVAPAPNYNYFFYGGNNYLFRPAIKISYNNVIEKFLNNIYELENRIFGKLRKIFEQLKKNNDKLYSKAIGYYYPILNALENHEKFYIGIYDKDVNNFNINKLSNQINRLNGILFLYYYLELEKIDIPKFLYNQLGNRQIVIFNNDNQDLVYPGGDVKSSGETDTGDTDRYKGTHAYISSLNYNNILDKISKREFFISRDILNENYIKGKKEALPPSIASVYNEFLTFGIVNVIKNNINKIKLDDDNIKQLFKDNDSDIQKKLLIATFMEDIIIDYLKNNVYRVGYNIFNQILKNKVDTKTIEKIFGPLDFTEQISKIDEITEILKLDDIKNMSRFYDFADPIILKQYKLYPNNYNSLNLKKQFYKIEVKDNIIELLINNGCNLFQTNSDGELGILNLIKYKKIDSLEFIKKKLGDSFDIFNNSNYLSPQKYIHSEYKLNLEAFGGNNNYEQIDNFTKTFYCDIVSTIIANEKLGYNILSNLKLSFHMCLYLTQQYLFESVYLHLDKDKFNEILKLINTEDVTHELDISRLYLNDIIENEEIPEKDQNILLEKHKKNFEKKITIFEKKKNNINNDSVFKDELDGQDTKIEDRITIFKNVIADIDRKLSNDKLGKVSKDNILKDFNLIGKYDKFLQDIGDERLVYLKLWSKIFEKDDKGEYNNLNNSYDTVIMKLFKYELENISELKVFEKDCLDINKNITNLFYKKLKIVCVNYFNSKYLNNGDKSLEFIKNILVHLTKNIICIGIEALLRKILLEYFTQSYTDNINNNIQNINLIIKIIEDDLYDKIAKLIVLNNSDVFDDMYEEGSFMKETNYDLLDRMIEKMINNSPILLDDKLKSNLKLVINYFETIIPKTINNWRVIIENFFLLIINHSNILEIKTLFLN